MIEIEQATCTVCGKPIDQKDIGPYKREYCSDRCRQKAYRQRERERKGEMTHRNVTVELQQRIAELEQEVEIHQHNAETAQQKLAEAQQRILHLERIEEIQRYNADVAQQKLEQAQQRILKLEQQVEIQRQRLGQYYQLVHNGTAGEQEAPPQKKRTKKAASPAELLPPELVAWRSFSNLHNVRHNDVTEAFKRGAVRLTRGNWKLETGYSVTEALDEQGRHDFWVQFHNVVGFRSCDACPHSGPS
jgi:predicted nucleic acid-binding Zn ribbon protein